MIEFNNVHLKYHYDEFELLKGVTFTLQDGLNTVLCDWQSGKTSICRLLIADIKPTDGNILVDGQNINGISGANLDILYLPSNPIFFEGRSVLHNVAYPLAVRKVARQVRQGIAAEMCERFGITDFKQKIRKLSAETRKKAALARALTVARKYVLWDDFFDSVEQAESCLSLFPDSVNIIFTSDASLAMGNTVVLDGGETVFQGDAEQAQQFASGLEWLGKRRTD